MSIKINTYYYSNDLKNIRQAKKYKKQFLYFVNYFQMVTIKATYYIGWVLGEPKVPLPK